MENEKVHMVIKSKLTFIVMLLSLMVPLGASADITVSITAVLPLDGIIAEGESATIYWKIEPGTASGDYDVVIGGDGTSDSGDPITSSDGSGTFNGTTSGSSTVSAANDLDGDGEYVVYVIAVDSDDTENYGSASTTVRLDSPPEMVNGLAAQGGDGRIFLSWDEHNDDDIINYLVYYDTDSGSTTSDFLGVDSDLGTSPVNVGDTTEVILSGMENGAKYYMRVTVTDETGTESPLSAEVSATPVETLGLADAKDDTEGCFIATAAYGSYEHRYVKVLRDFRDQVLLTTKPGRSIVDTYYKYSPSIAAQIAESPFMRSIVRAFITPLTAYAIISMSPAWSLQSALLLAAAAFFMLAYFRVRRAQTILQRTAVDSSRERRGRMSRFIAPLLILALVGLSGSRAFAQEPPQNDPHWLESPRRFTTGFDVGMIFPSDEDFQDIYGKKGDAIYTLRAGWRIFHELEINAGLSYAWFEGRGLSASGDKTHEKFKIHMAPAELGLVYRFAFVPDQVLVPYVGAMGLYGYWFEEKLDSSCKNRGLNAGVGAQAGLMILLDNADKRSAGRLESKWGINNTYLCYHFRYYQLDDFKDSDEIVDLSSQIHTAGILFQF